MGQRTPLYGEHVRAGARIGEFGGWDVPLYYTGIQEEHRAVRGAVGLFDVSHMGKLIVSGPGAADALSELSVNDVPREPGRVRYTHLLRPDGTILDDVVLTCLAEDVFLCVCNAAPQETVVGWIRDHLTGPNLVDATHELLCLALQGPRSPDVLSAWLGTSVREVRPFRAAFVPLPTVPGPRPREAKGWGSYLAGGGGETTGRASARDDTLLLTRTGYTGEPGFELFPWRAEGPAIWSGLLEAGRGEGIRPIGLGARDTLRLEKGYLLAGQDFDGSQTPLEAGADRIVKWDHAFVGREALREQRDRGDYRRLVGVRLTDRGIPRPGCAVLIDGRPGGRVTSGTHSPSLQVGIALAYVDPEGTTPGAHVEVDIRNRRHPAVVVTLPFV